MPDHIITSYQTVLETQIYLYKITEEKLHHLKKAILSSVRRLRSTTLDFLRFICIHFVQNTCHIDYVLHKTKQKTVSSHLFEEKVS